jgi:hypothetical protein
MEKTDDYLLNKVDQHKNAVKHLEYDKQKQESYNKNISQIKKEEQ